MKSPRLQCLHTRPMAINFTAKWCKGTTNHAPNALSHSPVGEPQIEEMLAEQDEDSKPEMFILQLRAISNEDRQKVCLATEPFANMQNRTTSNSLSRKSSWRDSWITKSAARIMQIILASAPYAEWKLYYIFMGVPTRMCKEILSQLHETHQAAVHTKQLNSLYTGQVW